MEGREDEGDFYFISLVEGLSLKSEQRSRMNFNRPSTLYDIDV